MNNPSKPATSDEPRCIRIAALLNTAATLGGAVLVAAMSTPKRPTMGGD